MSESADRAVAIVGVGGIFPDAPDAQSFWHNVRDGHYAIWGPFHLLTKVDTQGYPNTEGARDFVAYSTGRCAFAVPFGRSACFKRFP